MWEQVRLLVLVERAGEGGLGLWGDWEPFIFLPNSQEVKSARTCFYTYVILNFTIDTREVAFMAEEVVIRDRKRNAKPLTPWNLEAKQNYRIESGVRNALSMQ